MNTYFFIEFLYEVDSYESTSRVYRPPTSLRGLSSLITLITIITNSNNFLIMFFYLGTNYCFWQHGAVVVEKSSGTMEKTKKEMTQTSMGAKIKNNFCCKYSKSKPEDSNFGKRTMDANIS